MGKMNIITEKELAFIVVATLLNKFDFYTVIDGERGLGKCCHAKEVTLMHDGNWKNVNEVKVGDRVVSPQLDGSSTIETVEEVHHHLSEIYDIREVGRDKRLLYKCSPEHLIPVYKKKSKRNGPGKPRTIWYETINYSAGELAKRATVKNSQWMGFTSPMVEFEGNEDPTIVPYFLGVWLGDGSYTKRNMCTITTPNSEIIDNIYYIPHIKFEDKSSPGCYDYRFKQDNEAAKQLVKYNLKGKTSGTKFIPKECLVASKEYRLKMLAGLIDTDGYVFYGKKNGKTKEFALSATSIEYVTKSNQLAEDIKNLVYSLGGFCRMSIKIGRCQNNFSAKYNRLRISFKDPSILPLKCEHKKERLRGIYKHDPTHVAIEAVKTNTKEQVYGFSITGKSKWYVTSNWMVTHNSTVAFKLGKNVSEIFRKLYRGNLPTIIKVYIILTKENPNYTLDELVKRLTYLKGRAAYQFRPRDDLIYDQTSAKESLECWNKISIFDEFVNIGYSRDFFDKGQKDLIKLLNLNRDHTNLTAACIPHFLTADNQLRNLCKLRIYVHKRGEAVILSPNRGLSVRDRWDTDTNQKIELEWRKKGIKNPQWTRLTTFRAVMKTHPLTAAEEKVYQQIKNDKRANLIIKSDDSETNPLKKGYKSVMTELLAYKFKSYDELNAAAIGLGITSGTLRKNIKMMLKEEGKLDNIKEYFFTAEKRKAMGRDIKSDKAVLNFSGMSDKEIMERRRQDRTREFTGSQ